MASPPSLWDPVFQPLRAGAPHPQPRPALALALALLRPPPSAQRGTPHHPRPLTPHLSPWKPRSSPPAPCPLVPGPRPARTLPLPAGGGRPYLPGPGEDPLWQRPCHLQRLPGDHEGVQKSEVPAGPSPPLGSPPPLNQEEQGGDPPIRTPTPDPATPCSQVTLHRWGPLDPP